MGREGSQVTAVKLVRPGQSATLAFLGVRSNGLHRINGRARLLVVSRLLRVGYDVGEVGRRRLGVALSAMPEKRGV
jgi:hypothetical protein